MLFFRNMPFFCKSHSLGGLTLCLLSILIFGCGPGTFLGTWADILSPNPSSDHPTKQPYSFESSVNGLSFKRTSQARRLNKMKRIKVYGIDNREWGVLGIPKNNAYNGFSVTAGDLNGDQIDDIIIGAPESEGILPQTTRSG